jgi:phage terminase large subunit-like protein
MNEYALEFHKLKQIKQKLEQVKEYRDANMLQFMEWDKYKKQNEFRKIILDRVETGKGKKIFVVFGGNRSGKTELGAGVIAEALDIRRPLRILCATVNYSLSVQVQQAKVNKLLTKKNVNYGEFNPVRGFKNDIIEMEHGSTCIFRSYAQGRETVQGMDIDIAWLDEECPWDFFQEILARTADRNGIVVFSFTSLMGFTRLVNFLWEGNNPLIETTTLSILDNPFISEEAKKNWLDTIDEDEKQSRVFGKPHLKEGLIYKEFGDIHVVDQFDYLGRVRANPSRYKLHEGIDPHERTPHHWIRFMYDKEENKIYVVEELKAPRESMIVADYCRLIKQKRQGVEPEYCQIDTSSMKPDIISKHRDEDQEDVHTVRNEFFNNGINTILCSKDNAIGINEVKKRLKVVKTSGGDIKRMPLLYVCNNCEGVLWEFKRYSWDSYSSDKVTERKEMLNKPIKKNDHFMDIVKYECIKLKNDFSYLDEEIYMPEPVYNEMGY